MAAMAGVKHVARIEVCTHPDGNRFLASGQVRKARHFAGGSQALHLTFEYADAPEAVVHLLPVFEGLLSHRMQRVLRATARGLSVEIIAESSGAPLLGHHHCSDEGANGISSIPVLALAMETTKDVVKAIANLNQFHIAGHRGRGVHVGHLAAAGDARDKDEV